MRMKPAGFSLIELLIVVAVVSILGMIAYPSYNDHVRKGKRAEAKTRLLQIAQLEERSFTENNTYTAGIATLLGVAGNVYSSDTNDANSGYQITIAPTTPTTSYTLTATRQGATQMSCQCSCCPIIWRRAFGLLARNVTNGPATGGA